jgi:hypothetical protein
MAMKPIRALATALLISIAPCAHGLNTWGTDMSDLWWNPNESGWGINIVQQYDAIFATFFVYGADTKTRWYVAPSMSYQGNGANYVFSGLLYETQGPFLGGPFNPGAVTNRPVGNARLEFLTITQGNLTYNVDSASVTKTIQRQTFKRAQISGNYVGAASGSVTGCSNSGSFGTSGQFGVTLSPSTDTIIVSATLDNGGRCSYSGIYRQDGRMGAISGTLACTGNVPIAGTFEAFELEAGNNVIVLRYEAHYGSCIERGRIGGLKP